MDEDFDILAAGGDDMMMGDHGMGDFGGDDGPVMKIWDESAGESLLQIQFLAALRTFVSSLGYQSPLSYHMLIPILQSGINVDSTDALNLLEDSVLLWEATLSNAPSIVPQLLDLFPYLVGIMNRSFDHLEVTINIIEDYTIFGGSEFLKSHGASLANILDTIVGSVNDKGLLTALPVIDLLVQLVDGFTKSQPTALLERFKANLNLGRL